MKKAKTGRRRPTGQITLGRAARLYQLIVTMSGAALSRQELLERLSIGLRTFYRELELLKKCGIRIRLERKTYALRTTAEEATGRLPFPDPQLTFAEMAELAQGTTQAAQRLADLLQSVTGQAKATESPKKTKRARPKSRPE